MAEKDILERLMDFDRCGLTPGDRVNLRECAAIEIYKLRRELERTKDKLFEASHWDRQSQVESLHQLSAAVDMAKKGNPATYGGHIEFYLVPEKSAPEQSAAQKTAGGLPPETAQCAGADTIQRARRE